MSELHRSTLFWCILCSLSLCCVCVCLFPLARQNFRFRPRPKETRMASRHSPYPAFCLDVIYRYEPVGHVFVSVFVLCLTLRTTFPLCLLRLSSFQPRCSPQVSEVWLCVCVSVAVCLESECRCLRLCGCPSKVVPSSLMPRASSLVSR